MFEPATRELRVRREHDYVGRVRRFGWRRRRYRAVEVRAGVTVWELITHA